MPTAALENEHCVCNWTSTVLDQLANVRFFYSQRCLRVLCAKRKRGRCGVRRKQWTPTVSFIVSSTITTAAATNVTNNLSTTSHCVHQAWATERQTVEGGPKNEATAAEVAINRTESWYSLLLLLLHSIYDEKSSLTDGFRYDFTYWSVGGGLRFLDHPVCIFDNSNKWSRRY